MSNETLVYATTITTTPERLWAALTEGEFTRKYLFDRRIESTWVVGEPLLCYDGGSDTVTDDGTVLAYDPYHHLSYTFRNLLADPPVGASRVSFTLEPQDGGVKLSLVHDQFPTQEAVDGYREAWTYVLPAIKTLLETGEPTMQPDTHAVQA